MNRAKPVNMPVSTHKLKKGARAAWVVGTRGELLLLGPLMREFSATAEGKAATHWLFDTGEQGMAMQQTMDWLRLRADETAPLLHPADEASVRLQLVMERVEAFARQRKASHLIFTGFNATAMACALLCHTRGNAGLWLRPADPAGVIDGLRLESGYRRLIGACAPEVVENELRHALIDSEDVSWDLQHDIPGLRDEGRVVLIAVLRRDWGSAPNITGPLVQKVAQWARQRPELDWIFLSNLNARLERPVASTPNRPENMLIAPPLPYPVYAKLLGRAVGMLTDSPLFAGEALVNQIPVGILGDLPVDATGSRLPASSVADWDLGWLEMRPKFDTPGIIAPTRTVGAVAKFLAHNP